MTVENISIDVKTNAGSAAKQFRSLSSAISGVSKSNKAISGVATSAQKATKHTSAFASSLMRIAKYRLLRTALKEVSQAFSEGLKNAYHWSKEFTQNVDNSLAKSLDNLATKSLTMKNQMGAAFGALLQAIMPIIMQIISAITSLMRALSALFAAVGGGQYLVAKDAETGWDKATGAAKKYKNTILGFDEINRLNDENGGGGGSATDWTNMFKEGELPKWAQFIKDNFEDIKDAAIAIGIAIAGWKIAEAIALISGVALTASQLAGIALSIAGAFLAAKGAVDAFTNGATWNNINKILSGTAMLAAGLFLVFGKLGAAIGLLVGGLTLLAVGFKGWIDDGELSLQELYAIEGGLLAVGAAVALLTHSWIPLLIVGLAGLAIAIGTHASEMNASIDKFFQNATEKISGFFDYLEEKTGLKLDGIQRAIVYALNFLRFFIEGNILKISWIIQDLGLVVERVVAGDFSGAWEAAQKAVKDASIDVSEHAIKMANAVTDSTMRGETSGKDFGKAFNDIMIDVRNDFNQTSNTATEFGNAVGKMFPQATSDAQAFSGSFESVAQSVQGNLNLVDNSIITVLGRLASLKTAFDTANSDIGAFRNDYGAFGEAVRGSVLGYASGGVHDLSMGSLFVAGEAGAEIVTNLGNGKTGVTNVEQMEAAVANGNTNVVNAVYAMANMIVRAVNDIDPDIQLDGQSLADKMYHYNKQAATRYGTAMVT